MKKEIEILMMDGCTESEAEKHLKNGTIVITDFEECFDAYMKEWNIDEEEVSDYKKMIETEKPIPDWGIVTDDGKTYYIMYVL